jgi:plasmid stability protein
MPMAAICVRNLDDQLMELLRIRAARHGRSREAEVRAILAEAVRELGGAAGHGQPMAAQAGELGALAGPARGGAA